MSTLFYNTEESRLRSGWRIALFLIIFWISSATVFILRPLLGNVSKSGFIRDYSLLIILILAIAATLAVTLSRKFFDKENVVSLGLTRSRKAIKDVAFGFGLSGFMALLFFVTLLTTNLIAFNGINFTTNPLEGEPFDFVSYMSIMSLGSLFLILLENILTGYWEELVFRGYILQNMAHGLGWPIAIGASCIIYGLIHAANPNAGLLSTLIIMLFGFLRIYGYLSTKMLWLSIGMHIGWNFFQGAIFGFAASGHQKAHLIDITILPGREWLTGGEFGPEGSVVIIPIILLTLFIMKWYSKSQPH